MPRPLTRPTLVGLLILTACSGEPTAPANTQTPSFHFIHQQECTLTLGFWKNHLAAFRARTPNDGLNIGSVRYTEDQLLSILKNKPAGNGLIQLGRQLITAKLNGGEFDPSLIQRLSKGREGAVTAPVLKQIARDSGGKYAPRPWRGE